MDHYGAIESTRSRVRSRDAVAHAERPRQSWVRGAYIAVGVVGLSIGGFLLGNSVAPPSTQLGESSRKHKSKHSAHRSDTSSSSNVTVHLTNSYERALGRKIGQGLDAFKYLAEIHRKTTIEVEHTQGLVDECEYEAVMDGSDSFAMPGGQFNHTFTTLGWHNLTISYGVSAMAPLCPDSGSENFEVMVKYVRREIRTLTDPDRERFFEALKMTYSLSQEEGEAEYGHKYRSADSLVALHLKGAADKECDHWHDDAGIMSHHMAFTLQMEQSLQAIDPTVAMPYWDYTYDYYLAEHGDMNDFTGSVVFNDTWFGTASPDSNEIHVVDSGRWAFTPVSKSQDSDQIHNPYGLLRSPWNTNPVPYLTRYRYTYGQEDGGWELPSCYEFHKAFHHSSLAGLFSKLNGQLHGPVHVMIGGQWSWDQRFANLTQTWGGAFLLSSKYLWRQGIIRCPEYCSDDTPAERCVCSCPAETIGNRTSYKVLEETGVLELTSTLQEWTAWAHLLDCTNKTTCYDTMLDLLCHVGHVGEMFSSAAPMDPIFWALHGTAERFLSQRRLKGNLTETWGYDHGKKKFSDEVASDTNVVCDWSNVKGLELPICSPGTCPGHRADDILPMRDFLGKGESYSNMDFYHFTNPENASLPYIYDSYKYWGGCSGNVVE